MRADSLVFDDHERGPGETLRYQFEAIPRMPESDQSAIRVLLDAVIVKNQGGRRHRARGQAAGGSGVGSHQGRGQGTAQPGRRCQAMSGGATPGTLMLAPEAITLRIATVRGARVLLDAD